MLEFLVFFLLLTSPLWVLTLGVSLWEGITELMQKRRGRT